MSAIAGIIHFDGEPVARQDLERMGQALEPFGRDAQRLALGQGAGFVVRSSHVTPEDRFDRQPLAMGDQDFFLFDGRLDNRPDLIRQLGLDDANSRVMADCAVASHAWGRWGRESLVHMIGVFSVAHWRVANRCLTLGRSAPFGRALCVHRKGSRLYFASAPHGLFALPQVPRVLNEAALGDILLGNSDSKETLYQDIHVVFHAHWAEYRVDGSESRRFWAPDPGRRVSFKREKDAWEAFGSLFEDVVRNQLRSIHPVGIQMSGGLDSAAVAGQVALILAGNGKVLQGYTRIPAPGTPLRPDGRTYNDERPWVEQIARMHPNLHPHFVHAGDEPLLAGQSAAFAAAYSTYGEPATFSSGYQVLYRRAAADGVRVMFNGSLGNLTFSFDGIARLRALQRHWRWITLYRELSGLRRFRGKVDDIVREELLQTPTLNALKRLRRILLGRKPAPLTQLLVVSQAFAAQSGALGRWEARRGDDPYQHTRLNGWEQRARPYRDGGQGMADFFQSRNGLDTRSPGADRRVVEFCLSLPDEIFFKDGVDRRLARLGLSHLIPEQIRMNITRGRQDVDWTFRMRKEAEAIKQRLLELADDPSVSRYLDIGAMQEIWRQFDSIDWRQASEVQFMTYYHLMGGLTVGSFVRWFEQRN